MSPRPLCRRDPISSAGDCSSRRILGGRLSRSVNRGSVVSRCLIPAVPVILCVGGLGRSLVSQDDKGIKDAITKTIAGVTETVTHTATKLHKAWVEREGEKKVSRPVVPGRWALGWFLSSPPLGLSHGGG